MCTFCFEEFPRDPVLLRIQPHFCDPDGHDEGCRCDDCQEERVLQAEIDREIERDREFDERCALGYV